VHFDVSCERAPHRLDAHRVSPETSRKKIGNMLLTAISWLAAFPALKLGYLSSKLKTITTV
jgi:hypothetical protein